MAEDWLLLGLGLFAAVCAALGIIAVLCTFLWTFGMWPFSCHRVASKEKANG